MTEEQLRQLEEQLSCPSGERGIEIGKAMNQSNFGMTVSTIKFLNLKNNDFVLELGHGNCGHLQELLSFAENLNYYGLEISETMVNEAKKINQSGTFSIYDGELIPYPENYFDKVFSVNTIYFWSNPIKLFQEIYRTIKPQGHLVLTYANKEFMKDLLFVNEKFNLFDEDDIKQLAQQANLEFMESKEKTETVLSKANKEVNRTYTMAKFRKA